MHTNYGPLDCPHLAKGGFDRSKSDPSIIYCDGGHTHSEHQRKQVFLKVRAIKGDRDSSGRSSDGPGETEDASAKEAAK